MAESEDEFALEREAHGGSHHERAETAQARHSDRPNPDPAQTNGSASVKVSASQGDAFPASLRRKYYVVVDERAKADAALFYADERGEYLAFKLLEGRLTTRLTAPEVIRDMIAIAEHRHWTTLFVRGSVEFRREAWLEASACGMNAKGYEPTALDREALANRRTTRRPYESRPSSRRRTSEGKRQPPDRLSANDRVADTVTAIEMTQRRLDPGDAAPGRWRSRAARFRSAERRAAVQDSELVGAVSQLLIIERAIERAFPNDRDARERIMNVAKERIAEHLEQGRTFTRGSIRERTSHDRNLGERKNAGPARDEEREVTRQRQR